MKIPAFTATGPCAPPDGFRPYVYGAALGRPSRGRPEKVLERLARLGVIAPGATLPAVPRPRPERERREAAERARLEAARCPNPACRALPPNHLDGCYLAPMPDPSRPRCPGCEYPAGSLGCRMTHRSGT